MHNDNWRVRSLLRRLHIPSVWNCPRICGKGLRSKHRWRAEIRVSKDICHHHYFSITWNMVLRVLIVCLPAICSWKIVLQPHGKVPRCPDEARSQIFWETTSGGITIYHIWIFLPPFRWCRREVWLDSQCNWYDNWWVYHCLCFWMALCSHTLHVPANFVFPCIWSPPYRQEFHDIKV